MNRAYAVIVVGLAIAAGVFVAILLRVPADAQTELVVEVAKAAIGVIPVVFLSVIVSEVLKRRDEDRHRREQRDDRRTAFHERAIGAYNQSKSVRRTLRGAGFGPHRPPQLSEPMLTRLDEQMGVLSGAQLQFEQLWREAGVPGAPFDDPGSVRRHLSTIEKHLNRVLREWEQGRVRLSPGGAAAALDGWPAFVEFVDDKRDGSATPGLTRAFHELEAVLGALSADEGEDGPAEPWTGREGSQA